MSKNGALYQCFRNLSNDYGVVSATCRRATRGFLLGKRALWLSASSKRVVSGDFDDDLTHPKRLPSRSKPSVPMKFRRVLHSSVKS